MILRRTLHLPVARHLHHCCSHVSLLSRNLGDWYDGAALTLALSTTIDWCLRSPKTVTMNPNPKQHAVEKNIDRYRGWYLADCTCGWGMRFADVDDRDSTIEGHIQLALTELPCQHCGTAGNMGAPFIREVPPNRTRRVWRCKSCGLIAVESYSIPR